MQQLDKLMMVELFMLLKATQLLGEEEEEYEREQELNTVHLWKISL